MSVVWRRERAIIIFPKRTVVIHTYHEGAIVYTSLLGQRHNFGFSLLVQSIGRLVVASGLMVMFYMSRELPPGGYIFDGLR